MLDCGEDGVDLYKCLPPIHGLTHPKARGGASEASSVISRMQRGSVVWSLTRAPSYEAVFHKWHFSGLQKGNPGL